MGPLGVQEMIVIFLVALVLFGPKKLPELGKTIAKAVTEFRRAQSDLKATFEREMQSIERESESLKEATRTAAVDFSGFSEELAASANGTYGAGTADPSLPSSSTVSASEFPGAESPSEAEQDAILASLMNPPAAATEPGVTYGQPEPEPEPAEIATGVPGTVPRSNAPAQAPSPEVAQAVPEADSTANEAARHT